jgi:hypothetical protein
LFSTRRDGCSLTNFYNRCTNDQAPTMLFVKTATGVVMGAFLVAAWDLRQVNYYGRCVPV